MWVEGYWYPDHKNYKWHDGYWTRAPYVGAVWVAPRYERGFYFEGYWEGGRGRVDHDHYSDRGHDRDFHRDRDDRRDRDNRRDDHDGRRDRH
jgi:hypothetical protein